MSHLPIDKNILTLALYRISKKISEFMRSAKKTIPVPFRNLCFPGESTSETVGLTIFIAVDWGMAKNAIWYEW